MKLANGELIPCSVRMRSVGIVMAGVMGWYFAWQVVKLFLVDGMILAAALVWYRIWSQIDRPRLELAAAGFLVSCGLYFYLSGIFSEVDQLDCKSWEAVSFLHTHNTT